MQHLPAFALLFLLCAEPDVPTAPPSAEAEVEALLAASAQKAPPAELRIVLEGPASTLYSLEEGTVHLDGVPVPVASPSNAATATATSVSDGDHVVSARLVYRGQALGPKPWEAGPRWTLPARVALQARHGLRFTIRFTVELNERAPIQGQRLSLSYVVEPEMLVAVDDAPLPPPPTPQLPPGAPAAALAATSAPPLVSVPDGTVAAAPVKKKKKAARAKSTTAVVVPKPAATSPASAAVDPLEQATARLRSALAAPRDGGAPPEAGTAPRVP